MKELTNDVFYEVLKSYDRCIIDYCLIDCNQTYKGLDSHLDAIEFAMGKFNERYTDDGNDIWTIDLGKSTAELIDSKQLLFVPDESKNASNSRHKYDYDYNSLNTGGQIPYWYAFLESPIITGYKREDFLKVNEILFPNGDECLEAYQWSTDWSDYFDDGHEWWGTGCWSVFDSSANRFTVIMASITD